MSFKKSRKLNIYFILIHNVIIMNLLMYFMSLNEFELFSIVIDIFEKNHVSRTHEWRSRICISYPNNITNSFFLRMKL
jgi:hypothetical protein